MPGRSAGTVAQGRVLRNQIDDGGAKALELAFGALGVGCFFRDPRVDLMGIRDDAVPVRRGAMDGKLRIALPALDGAYTLTEIDGDLFP